MQAFSKGPACYFVQYVYNIAVYLQTRVHQCHVAILKLVSGMLTGAQPYNSPPPAECHPEGRSAHKHSTAHKAQVVTLHNHNRVVARDLYNSTANQITPSVHHGLWIPEATIHSVYTQLGCAIYTHGSNVILKHFPHVSSCPWQYNSNV